MSEIGMKKSELDTPVLWVDLELLEENIGTLSALFKRAGVQWRPHVKGIKTPAIAHKLLAAGAIGVTCAKLGEAEVMAAAGIHDILIANQVVGPHKMTRLVNLLPHAEVKVAVDSEANLAKLGQAAVAKGVEVGVLIELNTGMERTGVQPGETAVALARKAHETKGVRLKGIMAWEGHTIATPDFEEKKQRVAQAVGQLTETAEMCRAAGLPMEIVSGGGSGTYQITPFLPGITEIQAGGAIFSDVAYQSWGVETTPCLFVRSVVTSRPTPEQVIFDAGFKTLPVWHAQPRPVGIEGVEQFRTSAEHGILTLQEANTQIKIGEAYDFVLGYTDATLFLHETLYGIRQGIVEVIWEISARGRLR